MIGLCFISVIDSKHWTRMGQFDGEAKMAIKEWWKNDVELDIQWFW